MLLNNFLNSNKVQKHFLKKQIINDIKIIKNMVNNDELTDDLQNYIIRLVCNQYSINYNFYSVYIKN